MTFILKNFAKILFAVSIVGISTAHALGISTARAQTIVN
jgi:hypothetical protein